MRRRLIEKFTSAREGSLGYTLTELLIVIGIMAIVFAIAIPSFLALRSSLAFKQANDFARSIFLAAQQNLTAMRAEGALGPLQSPEAQRKLDKPSSGFDETYIAEYYAVSNLDEEHKRFFDLVLPAGSIDESVRTEQIIIEFNPLTGNVYAVFYSEQKENLLDQYKAAPGIDREDEKARKKLLVGYYDGEGLNSSAFELENSKTALSFHNGQEAVLEIKIPVPSDYQDNHAEFVGGLQVDLIISGQQSGKMLTLTDVDLGGWTTELDYESRKHGRKELYEEETDVIISSGDPDVYVPDAQAGQTLLIPFALDSLRDHMSFANLVNGIDDKASTNTEEGASLTTIASIAAGELLPGENVDIEAHITFDNGDGKPVEIETGIYPDINPLFDSLGTDSTGEKYTLYISNGRHLQNLNALAPAVAAKVAEVRFRNDIHWSKTVNYYNNMYGTTVSGGKLYSNSADEAPARGLPYFISIHNENLFGTAQFVTRNEYIPGADWMPDNLLDLIWDILTDFWDLLSNVISTIFNGDAGDIPVLTDDLENELGMGDHAIIEGNGAKVYDLNINAMALTPDYEMHFYAMGETQVLNYQFNGLFGYVNTKISNLSVVNPRVKGRGLEYRDVEVTESNGWGGSSTTTKIIYSNPATGAMVGAGGFNTLLINCSTYIDQTDSNYEPHRLSQTYFQNDNNAQEWYGVSGGGSVGGLVGFCKSHKRTQGTELNSEESLSFSRCFAAVNVSGEMRGNDNRCFGYTNGVGGLLGQSQLTNFFECYASGNVWATGCYAKQMPLEVLGSWFSDREPLYSGYYSMGAGGFVGTSHGTKYINCFATGEVKASNASAGFGTNNAVGGGGFVGFMSIDETYDLSKLDNSGGVEQNTVFVDCYAVGESRTNGVLQENFSGANGRERYSSNNQQLILQADYYCMAVAERAGGNLQNYYIYRDAHFLSDYYSEENSVQDNSRVCARPQFYDDFRDLPGIHAGEDNGEWIERQITDVRNTKATENNATYGSLYFNNSNTAALSSYLTGQYSQSFSATTWGPANDGSSHSYYKPSIYPFSKLIGMDYYGDWPSKPSDMGLAYYEVYSDAVDTTHFVLDQEYDAEDTGVKDDQGQLVLDETIRLRKGSDVQVLRDGYAIFSASQEPIVVTVNGDHRVELQEHDESRTINNSAYYIFYLPAELLEVAPEEGQFYVKVEGIQSYINAETGTSELKKYTMYYNPYVALSHINPDGGSSSTEAMRPQVNGVDEVPAIVNIRSARQFAGLSQLTSVWKEKITIAQAMQLDAAGYDWNADGELNEEDVAPVLGTIGTAEQPFNGKYISSVIEVLDEEGTTGPVVQAQVRGFQPTAGGFFGTIGSKGTVDNVEFQMSQQADAAGPMTVGAAGTAYAGLVAGDVQGKFTNVDVQLLCNVSLTADQAAGLMAGHASGSFYDCQVVSGQDANGTDAVTDVTITAPNAGGFIGLAEGKRIEHITTNPDGSESVKYTREEAVVNNALLNLNGTVTVQAPAGAKVYAGGFFAQAKILNSEDRLAASLKSLQVIVPEGAEGTETYAGGLAGGTDTVNLPMVTLTMTEASGNPSGVMAGYIGEAKESILTESAVAVNGLSGKRTAGMLGETNGVTLKNSTLDLGAAATVTGTESAAGMILSVGPQSEVSEMTLNLAGVTITGGAEAHGKAAGFAIDIQGEARVTNVHVTLSPKPTGTQADETTRITAAEAAGFVHTLGGYVQGSTVRGSGTISGADVAAGFALEVANRAQIATCGITPALANSDYLGNSNANLFIQAANDAAGFALTIGENATLRSSYTLGTIQAGTAHGFAGYLGKDSQIETCTANVDLNNGIAFLGTNAGVVTRCYGWYRDTAEDEVKPMAILDGGVFSCYFVDTAADLDLEKGVQLYTGTGEAEELYASELNSSAVWTRLTEGNGTGFVWYRPGGHGAFPYKAIEGSYPFPMLRDHYGDWVIPPVYSNGVAYYEVYENAPVRIHLLDMTGGANEEGSALTGYFTLDLSEDGTQATIIEEVPGLVNEDQILETGYYYFLRHKNEPEGEVLMTLTRSFGENGSRTAVYDFFELNEQNVAQYGLNINLHYANAIFEPGTFDNTYEIRTEEQLLNMGKATTGLTLRQTHDIELETFTLCELPAGVTYDGCGTGEAPVTLAVTGEEAGTWVQELKGTFRNLNLSVAGNLSTPIFETVAQGASAQFAQLTIDGTTGRFVDSVAGNVTLSSPVTFKTTADTVLFGSVAGSVTAADITTTGTVGSLFGTPDAQSAVLTGEITAKALKAESVAGQLFGDSTGTISLDSIETKPASGEARLFGTVAGTVNVGTISVPEGSISQVFGDVLLKGTVNVTESISLPGGANRVFREVSGTVNTGAITVAPGYVQSLFGKVTGRVHAAGAIEVSTNATSRVFGEISGTVEIGSADAKAGITVNGQAEWIFGDVKPADGTENVKIHGDLLFKNPGEADASYTQQVFGAITGKVTVDGKIEVSNAVKQVFGPVNGTVNVQAVNTQNATSVFGAVSGTVHAGGTINARGTTKQVFGTVSGEVHASGIAVNNAEQVFGTVGGTVTAGDLTNTGSSTTVGKLFGDVTGTVQVEDIQAVGTVGQVFGAVSGSAAAGKVELAKLTGMVVTSMTGGKVQFTGDIALTAQAPGSLFGPISGGTLSGTAVKLDGSLLTFPVFAQVSGGKVQNMAVTAESASTALVGGTLGGELSGVSLQVQEANLVLDGQNPKGMLVDVNAGTMTNCTVTVTSEDEKVESQVNVSGTGIFGGLVGENRGSITYTTASKAVQTMTISYEHTAGQSVIGGLVGTMGTGASIDGGGRTVMNGALNLNASNADCSYVVGGAIGRMTGGEAKGLSVNVTLSEGWDDAEPLHESATFGGAIEDFPAGVFVGYADGMAVISDCASTAVNDRYQFLGESVIKTDGSFKALGIQTDVWASDADVDKVSFESEGDDATSYTDDDGNEYNKTDRYQYVDVGITNCSFVLGGATRNMSWGVAEHYYDLTKVAGKEEYTAEPLGPSSTEQTKLTMSELNPTTSRVGTSYYVKLEDGSYRKMYVYRTWGYPGSYYISWKNDRGNFIDQKVPDNNQAIMDQLDITIVSFSSSVPRLNGQTVYMLVNGSNALTWGRNSVGTTPFATTFNSDDALFQARWKWSSYTYKNRTYDRWTQDIENPRSFQQQKQNVTMEEVNDDVYLAGELPAATYKYNGTPYSLYTVGDPVVTADMAILQKTTNEAIRNIHHQIYYYSPSQAAAAALGETPEKGA